MQSSKALSLGLSLKIYRNTTQEKTPLVIGFVVLFNFTAGADNAKRLLQEIVILPYLRPEVLLPLLHSRGVQFLFFLFFELVPIFSYFSNYIVNLPFFQIFLAD